MLSIMKKLKIYLVVKNTKISCIAYMLTFLPILSASEKTDVYFLKKIKDWSKVNWFTKSLRIIFFGLILNSLAVVEKGWASDNIARDDNFKFKIGFEFQEINALCKWAVDRYPVQKQSIFTAKHKGKKLWDIVIDTQDLEFVTPPFRSDISEDIALMDHSMKTIIQACKVLQALFSMSEHDELISFKNWISGRPLTNSEEKRLGALISAKGQLNDLQQKTRNQLQMKHDGLDKTLREQGYSLEYFELYNQVKYEKFTQNSKEWRPKFTPQVTIQHSLEDTIPLVITLFGSLTSANKLSQNHSNYLAALPYYNDLISSPANQTYFTKVNGLLFLHAFMCVNLITSERDEQNLLHNILASFEKNKEVDAKLSLSILSRRPFSHMWQEIRKSTDISFEQLYRQAIIEGNKLFAAQNVKESFKFINYAEEYYGESQLRPDYENLLPLFTKGSAEIRRLLQLGIFSTGMIRLLKPLKVQVVEQNGTKTEDTFKSIFDDYFEHTLRSVGAPTFRYDLENPTEDEASITIKKTVSDTDSLSPPWFLDSSDSMGRYKVNEDPTYGEAIVEFRIIKSISMEAIKEMKIDEKISDEIVGKYLMCDDIHFDTEFGLLYQVNSLFLYLKSLNSHVLQTNFKKYKLF